MLEYARDLRSDLKYAFEQDEGQTPNHKDVAVMDWLIKQAKIVNKIKDFCTYESDIYADLKMDDNRHKVDRILFNGKQKAFNNVLSLIKDLEES